MFRNSTSPNAKEGFKDQLGQTLRLCNTMYWNWFKKGRRDYQETGNDLKDPGEKSNLNVLECSIAEKQCSSRKYRETVLSF